MKKHDQISASDFEALLALLSENRDEAGEKYEQIRSGLIRFFEFRGCSDAEGLTDETINRVALKLDSYDPAISQSFSRYFYGFASNVLFEHQRSSKRESLFTESGEFSRSNVTEIDTSDTDHGCLDECLNELSKMERDMFVDYYSCEREEKAEIRRRICEQIECSAATLYTKIFRIKAGLRNCLENCLKSV